MGVIKEPPVLFGAHIEKVEDKLYDFGDQIIDFVFGSKVDGPDTVGWDVTYYPEGCLLIHVPEGKIIEGTKESFVELLEFAEEREITEVYLELKKSRSDFGSLIRTFRYFGFTMVAPNRNPALYRFPFAIDENSVVMVYRAE